MAMAEITTVPVEATVEIFREQVEAITVPVEVMVATRAERVRLFPTFPVQAAAMVATSPAQVEMVELETNPAAETAR
jgi:hypothetical protein